MTDAYHTDYSDGYGWEFSMIPHIADDELTLHEYRLFGHSNNQESEE